MDANKLADGLLELAEMRGLAMTTPRRQRGSNRSRRCGGKAGCAICVVICGTRAPRLRATRDAARRKALRSLAHDLRNQGDRLVYDDFRAAGYDIGSGVVESACDHVVAQRGKRNRMRWSSPGFQNTMTVRTSCLNGYDRDLWTEKPLRCHLLN